MFRPQSTPKADRRVIALATALRKRTVAEVVEEFCTYLHLYLDSYFARARAGQNVDTDLKRLISTWIVNAYYEGLQEAGIPAAEVSEEESSKADDLVAEQLSMISGLAEAVREAKKDPELRDGAHSRADLWCRAVAAAGMAGRNSGATNEMVEFGGDDGEESCATCQRLKGQRHRRKWFVDKGLVPGQPGNTNFECQGFNCAHTLTPV